MGGGFGALRAMNDAVKSNRELLKAGKKDYFDKDSIYRLSSGEIKFRDKKYNPEAIKLVRASAQREARTERIRAIIILLISLATTAGLTIYAWINL
jgi:hypothetical protein